jgi:hypothetical protein
MIATTNPQIANFKGGHKRIWMDSDTYTGWIIQCQPLTVVGQHDPINTMWLTNMPTTDFRNNREYLRGEDDRRGMPLPGM